MDIYFFNPWWKDERVPPALLGRHRKVFFEVKKYLNKKQILLFTGLRRAGKTTLMFQIIDELLKKKTNPLHILYFSFDEQRFEIEEILKVYESQVLKRPWSAVKTFLFFDEVHKLKDWENRIKILYDMNPQAKIFLSGSAHIGIYRGTRESLAGRFFEFVVKPLEFEEYLQFKNVKIDPEREDLFRTELITNYESYLSTGGFIEAIEFEQSPDMLRRYFKESLIERVIFKDIPESFSVSHYELLYRIMNITASAPGLYLDYRSLSNDLGFDHRTIANYVLYLQYALLVQKLYNYSPNLLTSEKKLKRLYLSNPAFTFNLAPAVDRAKLIEQSFVNTLEGKFFYRSPQKDEVDIVYIKDQKVTPVEIKIKSSLRKDDFRGIVNFMKRHRIQKALMITAQDEGLWTKGRHQVQMIPYWKYWSIKRYLT